MSSRADVADSPVAQEKGGGFYATAPGGASDLIVRGDIAVRQGELAAFGPGRRVRFSDGAEDEFDRVVFATGYTGFKETVAETLGPHAAEQLGSVWGLDAEGEVNGIARFAGIPRAFLAVGNFMTSRTLSKCIALQIVAQRDGNWGEPCECLAAGSADCRPGAPRRVECQRQPISHVPEEGNRDYAEPFSHGQAEQRVPSPKPAGQAGSWPPPG